MIVQPTNGGRFVSAKRLPDEYQAVEWIMNADASSYINSGISTDVTGMTVEADFIANVESGNNYIYGVSAQGRTQMRIGSTINALFNSSTGTATILTSDVECISGKEYCTSYTLNSTYGIASLTVNGSTVTAPYSPNIVTPFTLYLFRYRGSTSSPVGMVKFKRFKVCTDDSASELVPCFRKEDNAAGMYDLINATFIQGIGTFVLGNNIY